MTPGQSHGLLNGGGEIIATFPVFNEFLDGYRMFFYKKRTDVPLFSNLLL